MAYKQTPGRGNSSKTGAGLSPMLMGGSPMYQQKKKDPYSGKSWGELGSEIENFASENKKRVASEMIAKSDSTSAANNAMKLDKTLSKKMAARVGNEAANKTRSEKKIPRVNRGKYTDGSYMAPSKLGDTYTRSGKLEKDFDTALIKAYRKATPAKQMSKLKSGKSPAKQVSKMPTDNARDKRPADTMERNRGGAEPVLRKPGGRTPDTNGTAPRTKPSKTPTGPTPTRSKDEEKIHQDRLGKMTAADREKIKTGSKRPEGRNLEMNGTRAMPKASKSAPTKMKKC